MATEQISGFNTKKSEPLDVKELAANSAARLLIQYPYIGLFVKEKDTNKVYKYITVTPVDGSIPSNLAGDWERYIQVYNTSGVPSNTVGADDDLTIRDTGIVYKKIAGVWVVQFDADGAHIITGAPAPTTEGVNGDMYVRTNGDIHTKAAGVWIYQFNIRGTDGTADNYATTSTTSLDMTTVVAPLALTIGTGLAYTVGQSVIVASRGTPSKNLTGTITAYNTGSGAITLNPITPAGAAGAVTDWDVNLSGAVGQQGKAFIHTEHDINLNDAKITAVQAGIWTKANPWSASVSNDTRSSLIAPAPLNGSMNGHSVAYDGAAWYDNGRWLGFTGATGGIGATGAIGGVGATGAPGLIPSFALGNGTKNGLAYGYYYGHLGGTIAGVLNGALTLNTGSYITGTFLFISFAPGGIPTTISFTGTQTCLYKGALVASLAMSSTTRTGVVLKYDLGTWQVVSEVYAQTSLGDLQKIDAKQSGIFTSFGSYIGLTGPTFGWTYLLLYGSSLPLNSSYWRYRISVDILLNNTHSANMPFIMSMLVANGTNIFTSSSTELKKKYIELKPGVNHVHMEVVDVLNNYGTNNSYFFLYLENFNSQTIAYQDNIDYTISGVPFLV